jgi:hypothetical protein
MTHDSPRIVVIFPTKNEEDTMDNRMFPAKGIAMKKGINEAIRYKANIVLFLDADIKNQHQSG